ncbi:MAG: N-acetylmuramoyl-L-alanine amidase [Myxococcales bacterium]|nr:N-acetylmuramoyl-L-alanine amidase [Myxococcales bacterium]
MGDLIIAGQRFSIDAPIVNFAEAPFWDASAERCVGSNACADGIYPFGKDVKNQRARRYSYRAALRRYGAHPPLAAVRAVIRQFVVHHDGCPDSATCWNVLHNERGLSCHFLIDNDGTIYQTLDLAYNGYHAADFNPHSIGVELSNRGDALKDPSYYANRGQKRDVRPVKVHNHTYLAFDYTEAQYRAMRALAGGLSRLLPNLPLEYPQELPGHQAWGMLEGGQGYSGYLGHYHCTTRKWDPGPFDLKAFCEALRGAMCFPLAIPAAKDAREKPEVPATAEAVASAVNELYRANEETADGGFFPFGPWGQSRLWHGGVHLVTTHQAPVFSPFSGRVVAARMGGTSAVGSTNFALVKHRMNVGPQPLLFYSLYMHLADVQRQAEATRPPPRWLASAMGKKPSKAGEIILCDEPVEGGEVLGYVGLAGPAELLRAQLHFSIFSPGELFRDASPSPWTMYDGSAGGRFCDVADLVALVDADGNGDFSRDELTDLFLSLAIAISCAGW